MKVVKRFVGVLSGLAMSAVLIASEAASQQVPQSQAQIQLSFAPVVKQAAPAVVNIYAKIIRPGRASPFKGDPFFERFFRDSFRERPRVQNSLGSGVILSSNGMAVSNYHVVGGATDIRVVLADRREFDARVLLGDAESDLAILQLEEADDLPFLPLRDADTVEVGELVLAVGNPFGVGQTVSSGIVSGLARSGTANGGGRGYFIQTDAPINPGNSGGALVDMTGQLIGVNTSILTRSGGSNGIGFAIPADLVAAFVEQAENGFEKFQKPWAGVNGQAVDADMADALGFERPGGIVISGIHPRSPFTETDIRAGDVITHVNGDEVNTPAEMVYRMSVIGLGKTALVTRRRGDDVMDEQVDLVIAPDDPPRETLQLSSREVLEGMSVLRINPAVIAEYNLPLEVEGVFVAETGRLGRRAGFRAGDVILEINDEPVIRPSDVAEALALRSARYTVIVQRRNRRISLQFRM